jgi:hypothetical protein
MMADSVANGAAIMPQISPSAGHAMKVPSQWLLPLRAQHVFLPLQSKDRLKKPERSYTLLLSLQFTHPVIRASVRAVLYYNLSYAQVRSGLGSAFCSIWF